MSRLRPITLAVACCALLWLLAACRGGGDENVPFAVEEQAKIACTETCALHGQCGTLPDEQRAVLAGSVAPVVTLHDRFFLEGNLVIVQELSQRSRSARSTASRSSAWRPNSRTSFIASTIRARSAGCRSGVWSDHNPILDLRGRRW